MPLRSWLRALALRPFAAASTPAHGVPHRAPRPAIERAPRQVLARSCGGAEAGGPIRARVPARRARRKVLSAPSSYAYTPVSPLGQGIAATAASCAMKSASYGRRPVIRANARAAPSTTASDRSRRAAMPSMIRFRAAGWRPPTTSRSLPRLVERVAAAPVTYSPSAPCASSSPASAVATAAA